MRDAALQLVDLQVLAEVGLEGGLGTPLLTKERGIAVAREPAVHLQSGNRVQSFDQLLITDSIAKLVRALTQQLATNEVVEQRALLALNQLGGELGRGSRVAALPAAPAMPCAPCRSGRFRR